MRYPKPASNEWVQPRRRDYRLMCCDCGLVHSLTFRLVNLGGGRKKIQFRAERNQRSTALARRWRKEKELE